MQKQWIGCGTGNFAPGRPAALKPEMIVLHRDCAALDEFRARVYTAGGLTSAHYGVGRRGEIQQFVEESDTAFHCGLVLNPAADLVKARPGVNPNYYSLGITFEGIAGDPLTPEQARAAAQLLAEACARWSIPLDEMHVIPHSMVRASAGCPGAGVDIPALLREAAGFVQPARRTQNRTVRLLANANLRPSAGRSGPRIGVAPKGTDWVSEGFEAGEAVNGNPSWFFDAAGRFLWAGATDCPQPPAASPALEPRPSTDPMEEPAVRAIAGGAVPAPPGLRLDCATLALEPKQYYAIEYPKDLIVLHFTAGRTAASAVNAWRANPDHVATAFVVDTDGGVYQTFDPRFWAYHLGIRGTSAHDKRSIGIEIANVGPLVRGDGNLNWWWNDFRQPYCRIDERNCYVRASYRGKDYFAAFPPEQVRAVAALTLHLCERFGVSRVIPASEKRAEFDPVFFAGFRGVATHANFRSDKWDIGPAFDWASLGI